MGEYTEEIKNILETAGNLAVSFCNNLIMPEHLLLTAITISDIEVVQAVKDAGITDSLLIEKISRYPKLEESNTNILLSKEALKILRTANKFASDAKTVVNTEHIVLSSFCEQTTMLDFLKKHKIDVDTLLETILNIMNSKFSVPSEIAEFGEVLNDKVMAGKIDKIIGREQEINKITQILMQKNKSCPILIGEAGVGKSAIIEGLAYNIVNGKIPCLKDKLIFSIQVGNIISNTSHRGEMEAKIKKLIDFCIEKKNIILFIDEIHTIISSSSDSGEVSTANMLKPYLARGGISIIGATTTTEYNKYIKKDSALERRFSPVMVEPPTKEQTIEILYGLKASYEEFHNLKISDSAIRLCVKLADKYIKNRNFPDKAIDIIDRACSKIKVEYNKNNEEEKLNYLNRQLNLFDEGSSEYQQVLSKIDELNNIINSDVRLVDDEIIEDIIASESNVSIERIKDEYNKLINLENLINARIIGHEDIIKKICGAICRAMIGFKDDNRPIGSYLFIGPSGVGKTEIAKALAQVLFEDENKVININCTEFTESNSVAKLIGSPAGYTGHEDGGLLLTNKVMNSPFSVVVFDEIEKCHKDVRMLLLKILDEGKLNDAIGNEIDFSHTIIIMTSNIGKKEIEDKSYQELEVLIETGEYEDILKDAVNKFFPSELSGRINATYYFKPLNSINIAKIARIKVDILIEMMKSKKNITLLFTEPALKYILNSGKNIREGARPVRNILLDEIPSIVANEILHRKNDNLPPVTTAITDIEKDKIVMRFQ